MSEDVNIEVLDGGLGLVPSSGDEVHAVVGTCSLGAAGSIVATRSIDNLIASRGTGPGIEAAAFAIKQTGKTVLFCKAATATAGIVKDSDATPIVISAATAATPIACTTATPHGRQTGDVVVIAGGLVMTGINGTRKITKTGASSFTLDGTTGVGVYTAGSATVTPTGLNVSGVGTPGTSVPTLTGTPVDTFRFRWKWILGGTRGAAGATFKYSLDGGVTYSPTLSIGAATSYAIPNTGLTINFAAGTWVAGDLYKAYTVEPLWGDAGVSACIDALGETIQKFRLIHLVGDLAASSAVTFDTDVEALTNSYRYVGLLGHARDFRAADTDENGWIDALSADFSAIDSKRISVTAGHYNVVSPISGRKYRRPLSFVAAARLMGTPIQEHAGRVRRGALKGISIPSEADTTSLALDDLVYHDSRITPGLKAARFMTARTRFGRPGMFIDRPAMMASPTSDYQLWPHRSVIDKACDITYEILVDVLNDDLQLDEVTGHILDKEAKGIESRLRSAFRDGLTAKRAASAVSATISRDDNIITTKTLTAAVRVTPKGYVEGIDASVGFTNPALELG